MTTPTQTKAARAELFADRNFRWLIGGGAISMLGDQFTLLALPWLVLKLTGDSLILGTVLAAMSLPRAIFILVGGAIVDRYSPKQILMLTKYVNTALLGLLAVLVLTGTLKLWMVYGLALAIGLATAFSFPAGSSIIPVTIPAKLMQSANGLLMGVRQLSVLLGPVMAGGLIVVFGDSQHPGQVSDARGLGFAFAFDAFSYAFSAWTLARVQPISAGGSVRNAASGVFQEILAAMAAFWNDKALRALCLYYAAIAFFVGGPIQVALPVVADTQLGKGAASLGTLLAAHGAGTLLGMMLSGLRPNWRIGNLGLTLLTIDALAGLLLLPFGLVHATWQGIALLLPMGILAGFIQVAVFTWMQKRVQPSMLGRAMSLFMFIFMGLAPFSSALTGALLHIMGLTKLFIVSGSMLLALVVTALALTPIRTITDWRPETQS